LMSWDVCDCKARKFGQALSGDRKSPAEDAQRPLIKQE
jgi:hypothetical protein